jgi:glucose-1-phosphate adenylyltransferase
MGCDFYELDDGHEPSEPLAGIGKNCYINRAIIDKNARIGDEVTITSADKPAHFDGDGFYMRDGLVIIPKDTVIPSGTVI